MKAFAHTCDDKAVTTCCHFSLATTTGCFCFERNLPVSFSFDSCNPIEFSRSTQSWQCWFFCSPFNGNKLVIDTSRTRMHFSRMRTAHLLTVSQHAQCRGVSAQRRVCPGACLPRGTFARWDVSQHAMGRHNPFGQTDTCENITFANFVCGR